MVNHTCSVHSGLFDIYDCPFFGIHSLMKLYLNRNLLDKCSHSETVHLPGLGGGFEKFVFLYEYTVIRF